MSYYPWDMHDWGGWTIFHAAFWLLLLALIVAAAIALSRGSRSKEVSQEKTALDQLNERYARGEIDREEYMQRKKDIQER